MPCARIRPSFSYRTANGADWGNLHPHLLNLIFRNLHAKLSSPDVHHLLLMRLVCKAWRDACSEYTGDAQLVASRSTDLHELCKLLPHLQQMTVRSHVANLSTQSLQGMSHLSSISLAQEVDLCEAGSLLDLRLLPANLHALEVNAFYVDPSCFKSMSCVGITRLTFLWTRNTAYDIERLLHCLPKLQVRLHTHAYCFQRQLLSTRCLMRNCTGLTRCCIIRT